MHHNKPSHLFPILGTILLLSCAAVGSQSVPEKAKKKASPIEEAKSRRDAMEFFKKAEAMIGTPGENSEEQADLFRKAIQAKPDFLEAHYNLGLVYANQKKMPEASAELEAVLKIEPEFDAGIYMLLATTYQGSGDSKAAIAALEEGLRREPKSSKFLRALAYLQFNNKNDAAAIQNLLRLLDMEPNDASIHMDLALLYQRNNDLEKAEEHFQDILRQDPANYEAHYNLAILYSRQKRSADAAAEFETANKIRPGDADLLERLGDAYAFQSQHAKAVAAYKAALQNTGDQGSILAKLGFSLANLNRIEEAVGALERAEKLNDKSADIPFLLGDLYSELKRFDDAIAAYTKSIQINPKQKEVHYNLGTLFAEQNRLDDARTELKIAVDLDPDYAAAWSNIALVAEKLERDAEAIQAHEKVIALGKAQALNFFHLGILYAKSSQVNPAIAAFARAIEMEPDKYRAILREELKKVHSILDPVRYKEGFTKLLNSTPAH